MKKKPLFKRVLRNFFLGLLTITIAFIIFYIWAIRGQLPENELVKIKTYHSSKDSIPEELSIVTFNIGYLSGMTNNLPVDREKNYLMTIWSK